MIYLQRHNNKNTTRRLMIYALISLLLLIGLVRFFYPYFLSSLFTSIAYPFWRTEFSIRSGSTNSPTSLVRENEELRRTILENEIRLMTVRDLESENEYLKLLFGRASTSPRVLSAVLERPPLSLYDELIIDIGLDHNVSVGSSVYAIGDVLIGRVVDVLSRSSRVILFSSPKQTHEVVIGEGSFPATAIGRGGGQYEAQISRGINISQGDHVYVPSLDSAFFGIVSTVISDPTQPFERILFASPVNMYQLRWVLVDVNM